MLGLRGIPKKILAHCDWSVLTWLFGFLLYKSPTLGKRVIRNHRCADIDKRVVLVLLGKFASRNSFPFNVTSESESKNLEGIVAGTN